MVLALSVHITDKIWKILPGKSNRSILRLPGKKGLSVQHMIDKMRGCAFHFSDEPGERDLWRHRDNQMDMILRPSDRMNNPTQFSRFGSNCTVQLLLDFRVDEREAIFCPPDEMIEKTAVWHVGFLSCKSAGAQPETK